MDKAEASGHVWWRTRGRRWATEQDRNALAHRIRRDADQFKVELYKLAADPLTLLIDRAHRRRAGQHERHVRRLNTEVDRPKDDGNLDGNDGDQAAPRIYVGHRLTSVDGVAAGWLLLLKAEGRSEHCRAS